MRRRHLLALVVLVLLTAVVLTVGPGRVWHAVAMKTVEEYNDEGKLRWRRRIYWWRGNDRETRTGLIQAWSPAGTMRTNIHVSSGEPVRGITSAGFPVSIQWRYVDGRVVERRLSPPWFTESEMLRSVRQHD